MILLRSFLVLLLACTLLYDPAEITSCASPPLHAVFTAEIYPEHAENEFARGDLGILQPKYRRLYLLIAYRYLSGGSLNEEQRAKLFPPSVLSNAPYVPEGPQAWFAVHREVPNLAPVESVDPYRVVQSPTYSFFLNCHDDAFDAAAQRLRVLIAKFGRASARVRDWTIAQDMVFTNCSQGQSIPEPLPLTDDPQARADRAYQIAAAHFYSGQLDQAEQEFAQIGKDTNSPWQKLGPYLVARTMVRQGALTDAEKQLNSLVADPAQGEQGHERAQRLLEFIRTRLYPDKRLIEAASNIVAAPPKDLKQSITDYTYVYDSLQNHPEIIEKAAAQNDLTDWVAFLQRSTAQPPDHAVARWKATGSTAWLIAALYSAGPADPANPDLIRAAHGVRTEDPGYLSAQYYAIVLLEREGQNDAAREQLDGLLNQPSPRSARNTLLAARMKVAQSWQEFLRFAPRIPAGEDGADYESFRQANPNAPTHDPTAPGFDADAALILARQIPLDLLASAAVDSDLPSSIRRNLCIASWTRAVLLGRLDVARKLAPALGDLVPALRADLTSFENASAKDQKFDAVWITLRNPGLRPYAETGFGRLTPMNRINDFRDNWWCAPSPTMTGKVFDDDYFRASFDLSPALSNLYGAGKPAANFLSAEQRKTAENEWASLDDLPTAPDFLSNQTLIWAKAHPDDPRVPEALHLAVRTTRYGCVDAQTQEYSKQAFELLHRSYPNSRYAKETPYWFKY